mmetsp:Transcript_26904/g.79503  ORF Transcript_26904/g.79503 Transcript_26904/m.79503 type:complete len:262 (-) Transcript_26904:433-1218(-)
MDGEHPVCIRPLHRPRGCLDQHLNNVGWGVSAAHKVKRRRKVPPLNVLGHEFLSSGRLYTGQIFSNGIPPGTLCAPLRLAAEIAQTGGTSARRSISISSGAVIARFRGHLRSRQDGHRRNTIRPILAVEEDLRRRGTNVSAVMSVHVIISSVHRRIFGGSGRGRRRDDGGRRRPVLVLVVEEDLLRRAAHLVPARGRYFGGSWSVRCCVLSGSVRGRRRGGCDGRRWMRPVLQLIVEEDLLRHAAHVTARGRRRRSVTSFR